MTEETVPVHTAQGLEPSLFLPDSLRLTSNYSPGGHPRTQGLGGKHFVYALYVFKI